MLFGSSRIKKPRLIALSLLTLVILITTSCAATKGSIVILEDPDGKGFVIDFSEWSASEECKMSLKKGDVLHFDVSRKEGEIALNLSGRNGSETLFGKRHKTRSFHCNHTGIRYLYPKNYRQKCNRKYYG
jgi:hypothetical protein